MTGYWGATSLIVASIVSRCADDGRDELAGERRGRSRRARLGEVALEDRVGGALAEVGLEDGREREATSGVPSSPPARLSLRRHRP